ncbi:MAG: TlpA disulfide reductase family protein [Steroidobacteraceae bacterium]
MQQEQNSLQGFGRLWLALVVLAALSAAALPAPAASGLLLHPAPDFALRAASGSNVRLSEYRGQPVVLSFWSSRCGRCAAQLAALDRYYATYHSSGLVVFGISVEDDPQRALDYAHAHQRSFPLLLDGAKGVSRAFDIATLPTTILIDRSGVVRYLHGDDRPDDPSYVAQIRALLDDRLAPP